MTSIVHRRVMQDGPGTVTFWWKVSSEANYDWLSFYVDGVLQDRISGEVGWQQKSYPLGGDGKHALVWVYSKDSSSESGSDRGWVDYLQWTPSGGGGGSSTTDWEQITYTYDPSGRRIAKDVDGVVTRYVYDGDHCIAEYDANDVLLRKFIHGPSIDEPICMIEAAGGYAGTYFYHYDALGSVVALSDDDGDTVQVYEYDVYGQVAASDPNHPNRFLFTGREFDTETGLYYYRARYYNPAIGRFLQTDPIGYEGGTNWYMYCTNNPWNALDPFGLEPVKVDDREGYIYDLWARPAGHPALERGQGPYYSQTYRMSCVPTAILNWWLTYNVDLSAKAGRKIVTDLQAEEYVMGLLTHEGRFHDWNTEGVKNMMMIESVMIGVVDKSGVMEGVPQAGTIVANVVKHDKAMMVAVDMSMGAGTGWHCIMIAPTPQDYIEDWIQGYGYDPGPISVIGLGYEHPQMYSESDFATWWEWMLKNNLVADAYYVGPDVPEGNGSAE